MNPKLDIVATDNIKTNVTEGSGSRLVNFLVTLMAGGNLNAPKISFDMSTEDDASIKNELQSMSADQRQTTAMNLVLTGHYTGSGTKMGTPQFQHRYAVWLSGIHHQQLGGAEYSRRRSLFRCRPVRQDTGWF